jgi:hypothetical protein
MGEEFFAVIKLISGEEIFSKVCPCEEDDRTLLILENPVTVETVSMKQFGMSGLKINPWIKFTDDSMFVLNMDRVLTLSEVSDETMLEVYARYLKKKNKETSENRLSSNMGYLSTVADARISFEKLYKSNPSNNSSN